MTNEEAIKEIQDASDYEVRHGDIEHHYEDIMRRVEAFEKAVNALQQEPVYFPPCVDCNTKMNEIREAYDKLKNQSWLRWIERFDNEDKWLECPHCHTDSTEAYNYCPNCGADMRESEGKE